MGELLRGECTVNKYTWCLVCMCRVRKEHMSVHPSIAGVANIQKHLQESAASTNQFKVLRSCVLLLREASS